MPRLRAESTLFVLIFIASMLMLLYQLNLLKPFQDAALTMLSPIQSGFNAIWAGVSNSFGGFREAQEWRQKFDERQKLMDELIVQNTRLKEKEKENEALRELLAFRESNRDFVFKSAQVIGRDPNPLLRYIIIDRGATDGITTTMTVVTARGLVGQVTDVSFNSAKVMLITDRASAVNVLVQETRAQGTAQGDSQGRVFLRFVPQSERLAEGHVVLTSGQGGRFPKKLVVGQLENVRTRDVDLFQSAEIRPSVDFGALEFVLVITNFAPSEP